MGDKEQTQQLDPATPVDIECGNVRLTGDLTLPDATSGIVAFAHGSGSSRLSPRNQFVARILNEAGLGTLLFDLLTPDEEREDRHTARLRFDIDLLANRLAEATDWLDNQEVTNGLRLGYFGASTGAAAALIAAAAHPDRVAAIVSRGGRPDLAGTQLERVRAPTLLIVGGLDFPVIDMNLDAYALLSSKKKMEIVENATHLFEEPGALEEVARLAVGWFHDHLAGS